MPTFAVRRTLRVLLQLVVPMNHSLFEKPVEVLEIFDMGQLPVDIVLFQNLDLCNNLVRSAKAIERCPEFHQVAEDLVLHLLPVAFFRFCNQLEFEMPEDGSLVDGDPAVAFDHRIECLPSHALVFYMGGDPVPVPDG